MGGILSKEEEEIDIIDPIRIVWDDLGNLKLVTQIVAEEKYNEKNRKNELESIIKAEWEDQQEQEKLDIIKAKDKEDKEIKRKQYLEQLREEYREKVNNAIKKGEDYPSPFIEPKQLDDIEETLWYVMSSAWIESWLEYVDVQRGLDPKLVRIVEAPYPGPCDNSVLLEWSLDESDINDTNINELNYRWRAKKNLILASNNNIGDYRRVSKRVWEEYKKLYPKSGPEIIMKYIRKGHYENAKLIYTGSTDIKDWIIKDLPPPVGAKFKKSKKQMKNSNKKIDILSNIHDEEININDNDNNNNNNNDTAKSPIMNLARLTSSGPDSDDDSNDDIILSSNKNNNRIQSSSPPMDKIAFHTIGKDSDDDDDDLIKSSPPKSIISSLTKSKTNNTPIRLNKDSDDDDDDDDVTTKTTNIKSPPIKTNSKLPPISLKKDSDDDSDEGFDIKKDNNEKLLIGKLGESKVTTITNNKTPTDNKSPAIFSLNKYTSNINEVDSDDDDTIIDEKDNNKGFNNLKITPNQNKLAINLNSNNNDETQRRISESGSDNNKKTSRISETNNNSSDSMSIMSLLTSKKN